MAKVKKIKKAEATTNVLTTEELQGVKNFMGQLAELKERIGDIEITKAGLLAHWAQAAQGMQTLKEELEGKYGKITVDTVTGIYTPIVDEDGTN